MTIIFGGKNKGGEGDADRNFSSVADITLNSKSHTFAVFIFRGDFRLRLPKGVTLISGIFCLTPDPKPAQKITPEADPWRAQKERISLVLQEPF